MPKYRSLIVVTLVLLTILSPSLGSPAAANFKHVDDHNDSAGRLDIKWLRQGHDEGGILYALRTLENWADEDLRDGRFILRFNIDGDATYERFVIVHWRDWKKTDGGRLASPVKNSKRRKVGSAGAAHWGGNNLRVWVARRHLGHVSDYRMNVMSEWRRGKCRDEGCVDHAPDEGTISHHVWPLCFGYDPTIVGTKGNDHITGTKREDWIYARGGDDVIDIGPGGGDYVCGGAGDDTIFGGRYSDNLEGGTGADELYGRRAVEGTCSGEGGPCPYPSNRLFGGPGPDRLVGGRHGDQLYGGRGYDYLDGGDGFNDCYGGEVEQRC